jgi:hypothetical protein
MEDPRVGAWKPATKDEVEAIIAADLRECTAAQRETWKRYCVPLRSAPIERYGKSEHVFIVAQRGNEVLYWEDVEEGFNFSELGPNGEILEHSCNQDGLQYALNKWTKGSGFHDQRRGPAEPVPDPDDLSI